MILGGSTFRSAKNTMGFADLSIAELAEDYGLSPKEVLRLCDRFGIAYQTPQTRLALEDAKTIIQEVLSQREDSKS
jgi:AraC-like DNA-binding protein